MMALARPPRGVQQGTSKKVVCAPVSRAGAGTVAARAEGSGVQQSIHSLLSAVAEGRVDIEDAAKNISDVCGGYEALRPSMPDFSVIDAGSSSATQLAKDMEGLITRQHTAAARNVASELYAAIRNILPGVQYHAGAQMLLLRSSGANGAAVRSPDRLPGRVAIICGSSSDMKTAFETKVTCDLMGVYATMSQGVSVQAGGGGLVGLARAVEAVEGADAIVVCGSEEPALPGLVSGLVEVPVTAIPGVGRPEPVNVVSAPGMAQVAAGDGVSAAAASVRTMRIAARYISHRKKYEERAAPRQPSCSDEEGAGEDDRAVGQMPNARDAMLNNVVPLLSQKLLQAQERPQTETEMLAEVKRLLEKER